MAYIRLVLYGHLQAVIDKSQMPDVSPQRITLPNVTLLKGDTVMTHKAKSQEEDGCTGLQVDAIPIDENVV